MTHQRAERYTEEMAEAGELQASLSVRTSEDLENLLKQNFTSVEGKLSRRCGILKAEFLDPRVYIGEKAREIKKSREEGKREKEVMDNKCQRP